MLLLVVVIFLWGALEGVFEYIFSLKCTIALCGGFNREPEDVFSFNYREILRHVQLYAAFGRGTSTSPGGRQTGHGG